MKTTLREALPRAAGLVLLAFVGRTAVAGAMSAPALPADSAPPPAFSSEPSAPAPPPNPSQASASARGPATADDPVVLNTATVDDLRRLPGIGEKRATAIVALRTRMGRFRAIEDLLKVKGVGRATIRRLRPLVRVDLPAAADGGAPVKGP